MEHLPKKRMLSTGLIGGVLTSIYFKGWQRRIYAASQVIGHFRKAGIL